MSARILSEAHLIKRLAKLAGREQQPGLMEGIGDDCAIFRPRRGHDLVFTTDMLIENVHFLRQTPPSAVGHKALARGLSDIAAMGAEPVFCLVSLAAAPWTDQRWILGFYRGLMKLARRFGTALAGGDLSRSGQLTCDIVACGSVRSGKALRRSGARPGDRIYVSGPLGRPWETHLRPEPRIAEGLELSRLATAAMDLSDGLSLDLRRLCEASQVGAELDSIPVYRGSTLERALHGGEDYQLLFTAPPRKAVPAWAIHIGTITAAKPGQVRLNGRLVPPLGYDHFRRTQ